MLVFTILLYCVGLLAAVNAIEQSVEAAAHLTRRIVADSGRGHILTLMDSSVSNELSGFPFGIMEYYSVECTKETGNLLLFMSDLQLSARNMHQNPDQMAFTITALKDYNVYYGNRSTPVQQPRFTLFGHTTRIPESKVSKADKHTKLNVCLYSLNWL
ncbi:uncharacterized protein B0P05DRAFT_542951 [Gilbertella persicaria]|uniref:uncharacterized protein n=1 Tax=Gilbertella persicaria TaxID=101096 RepID=UPI0022205FFD|nr:uncharacterized protein B0P05DRAFT_542951 [Gilbertella persicaria]KAI8078212.1 hypothetical protein B0P05DRAFT_542951 [Gilbertella persicaria]